MVLSLPTGVIQSMVTIDGNKKGILLFVICNLNLRLRHVDVAVPFLKLFTFSKV